MYISLCKVNWFAYYAMFEDKVWADHQEQTAEASDLKPKRSILYVNPLYSLKKQYRGLCPNMYIIFRKPAEEPFVYGKKQIPQT